MVPIRWKKKVLILTNFQAHFPFTFQQQQTNQQQNNPQANDNSSWTNVFQQLMSSSPEVAGVVSTFEKYIPFMLILSVKQLFDFSTGKTLNLYIF